MKFSDLMLHSSLQSKIDSLGFVECTPVQEQTIPSILEGKDVAGLAQTGTGKTAAFLLPLMERIVRAQEAKRSGVSEAAPAPPAEAGTEEASEAATEGVLPFTDWVPMNFVLVLVPTRELAEQVYENAVKFGADAGLRAVSVYGGVAYDRQKEALRGGVEFVIATPGRLIDLYKEHVVDLKQVRAIVFDEADRMFDMGFKDDMKYILTRVPKERQFLVFSATLNLDVMNTAYQFGANPIEFNVSRDQAKAENVEDKIFHVGQEEKGAHLLALIKVHNPRQVIVFSNFKMNVPRLSQFLNDNGVPAVGISSLLTQSQRNRVMEQFKGDSDKNVLVATDVAARGLDIKGVDMVVNFELPDDPENYVHRIGRTGRAGAKGVAFSLVSDRDVDALSRIEGYLKHKVDVDFLEESQLPKDFRAMQSDRAHKDFSREFEGRAPRGGEERGRGGGGRPGGRPHDRGSGSGPRRDRGGDRPERRDHRGGEQRPPRAEGASTSRPMPQPRPAGSGPTPHAGGGPGGNRHGEGGRRNEGRHEARHGGGKHGTNGKHHGPQQGGRGGPKSHGKRNDSQDRSKYTGRPIPKGSMKPSIGQKVTGFFKKLLGG